MKKIIFLLEMASIAMSNVYSQEREDEDKVLGLTLPNGIHDEVIYSDSLYNINLNDSRLLNDRIYFRLLSYPTKKAVIEGVEHEFQLINIPGNFHKSNTNRKDFTFTTNYPNSGKIVTSEDFGSNFWIKKESIKKANFEYKNFAF